MLRGAPGAAGRLRRSAPLLGRPAHTAAAATAPLPKEGGARWGRVLAVTATAAVVGGWSWGHHRPNHDDDDDDDGVQLPAYVDRATRFTRAAATAVVIALDYKWSLRGLEGEERQRRLHLVHERSADRLLRLFQQNKGIYVKAGQHISSLDYILPYEFVFAMTPLHNQAPTCPWEDTVRVFREEFDSHPDIMFAEFEREPVAAASLAQVHRARTHDGREVAVKVQFPQLRERCEGDVSTIAFLVDAMRKIFPDFDFQWLVGEFRLNLPLELDFAHEAKNAEKTARLFREFPDVTIPRIHWDKTTSRILTMDFIHGVKLDDKEGIARMGLSTQKVAELLTTVFSKQIFLDGFVHCDPHPGNVLIRRLRPHDPSSDDPELVLLDHGLYRELDDEFRINYCNLWVAIIHADEAKIKDYARILCGPDASYQLFACMLTARAWESVKELDRPITQEEKRHLMSDAADRFKEINDILATVPSQLLLLLKTNDLLRALNRDLGHPVNTYSITAKYCVKAVLAHSLEMDPSWRHRVWVRWEAVAWAVQIKATELVLRLLSFFSHLFGRFYQ